MLQQLFKNPMALLCMGIVLVTALLGIFAIAASLNGHLYKKVHWALRIVLAVGGLGMMIPGAASDIAGAVVIAAMCGLQLAIARKKRAAEPLPAQGAPVETLGSAEDSEERQ